MRHRPFALPVAAAGLAAEAAGLCVASVLSARDTAAGQSYQYASGIALTVIGFCTVGALALVAVGVARARRWSWTPAMLIQLFGLIVGIYLLQSHRYDWGVPAVVLAAGVAVLLLLPRSLDALGRRPPPEATQERLGGKRGTEPPAGRPTRPRSGRP